mmetsp:Transcript_4390/g.14261  ORF Transcript_4390/g.14261 Transcript_4390/m.14261 type:complete len:506 (+) Transcript_4390:1-1518(+)
MKRCVAFLAFAALFGASYAAYCHGSPSPDAKPNTLPIFSGKPQLARVSSHGKAYIAGNGEYQFWLLHLWGTPYEMGRAHGEMMKPELEQFFKDVEAYMKEQVEPTVQKFLPKWAAEAVAEAGLDMALDLTADATRPYTGTYFFDEAQGLADAVGIDVKRVWRVHMIGELTKGSCSMFGAWGEATKSANGDVLQLRALDWDVEGPYRNYPAVIVYHPAQPGYGNQFANVGFLGWFGSITGMSERGMAISEIGVSFPDPTFGEESRYGVPFTFILRDILQFDNDLDQGLSRLITARRTCDLILGVGDGKTKKTFRAIQYSHSVANVQNDTHMMPHNDTWHPRIKNIVYYGMDWLCPAYNQVMAQQLQKHYGNITPQVAVHDIVSIVQTGNLHIAIYDLANDVMYVSFAAKDGDLLGAPFAEPDPDFYEGAPNGKMAYDRQFTQLDMGALWDEAPPTEELLRSFADGADAGEAAALPVAAKDAAAVQPVLEGAEERVDMLLGEEVASQ